MLRSVLAAALKIASIQRSSCSREYSRTGGGKRAARTSSLLSTMAFSSFASALASDDLPVAGSPAIAISTVGCLRDQMGMEGWKRTWPDELFLMPWAANLSFHAPAFFQQVL